MDPARAVEVAALSNLRAITAATARGDSDVQRFYSNSVVFLTGGSGFLGKQLIEKLLRSCQISKVYMLIRPKKGNDVQQRLDEILKDPAFDTLSQQQPKFADKIIIIEGDVAQLKLGIKDEDWRTLIEEVNVIFHVAATTRFDETLRTATLINVRGTREALLLGKACKKLRSYVHVSTAYSHATTTAIGSEVDEKFYDAPVPPETMISMVESMEADRLTNITPALIKNWPNSYTFTKSISEELVRKMSDGLPICIVRPAIVLCSYHEPSPGWLDPSCVYGATAFLLGIGVGVLHTFHAKFETKLGFIPCDFVNNAIIVAGRETAASQVKGGDHTKIYTVSSILRNNITAGWCERVIRNEAIKYPTPSAIYYTWSIHTSSVWIHNIVLFLFHIIPACLADIVCLLMGKQRRFLRFARKGINVGNVLKFFLFNDWIFNDNNLNQLYNSLSTNDKAIFNFDVTCIDWTQYIIVWCLGVRKYIIKDGLKGTEYALKKQRYLAVLHYIITPLYLYGLWKLTCFVFYIISCLFSLFICNRSYGSELSILHCAGLLSVEKRTYFFQTHIIVIGVLYIIFDIACFVIL